MTQIAYSGSFWAQFRVSRDLFTDLAAVEATVSDFLTAATYSSESNSKLYQTPQWNLPIMKWTR